VGALFLSLCVFRNIILGENARDSNSDSTHLGFDDRIVSSCCHIHYRAKVSATPNAFVVAVTVNVALAVLLQLLTVFHECFSNENAV